jgi:diguanylate cyclase (GGDEF)-like protein/PAS domain S-box-containing protein
MNPEVRFLDSRASWALRSWDRQPAAELLPGRHESLLRHEPEKYSEMVQGVTSFGIYLIDRGGIIRSWNRGAANLTGHEREQVVGQAFQTLFLDEDVRAGVPRRTLEFVRMNHHVRDEQRRALRSGGSFVAQIALDALRADSGELLGFVEVFQDITESKQREERLYQRATRDALTGAANRGHFAEMATIEIDRAKRFAEPLSLLLIDVDHFKRINDTYGHETGDRVIQTLAETCMTNARKIDLFARLGGEEFAMLLPRANKEPAAEIAQRLRRVLGERRVPVSGGREIAFTVSIGVSSLRPTTRDLAELLRNADAALYKAKREGRNRVEVWFE